MAKEGDKLVEVPNNDGVTVFLPKSVLELFGRIQKVVASVSGSNYETDTRIVETLPPTSLDDVKVCLVGDSSRDYMVAGNGNSI